MIIKKRSKTNVDYESRFKSGEVFGYSFQQKSPLEFFVRKSELMPGFEKSILEMALNEEKEVKIKPKDEYEERNPKTIQKIPLKIFSKDIKEKIIIRVPIKGEHLSAIFTKIIN